MRQRQGGINDKWETTPAGSGHASLNPQSCLHRCINDRNDKDNLNEDERDCEWDEEERKTKGGGGCEFWTPWPRENMKWMENYSLCVWDEWHREKMPRSAHLLSLCCEPTHYKQCTPLALFENTMASISRGTQCFIHNFLLSKRSLFLSCFDATLIMVLLMTVSLKNNESPNLWSFYLKVTAG